MKNSIILVLALLLAAHAAYGKDLELSQEAGGYAFRVRIDRNPPILGDNHIEIEIKDGNGTRVTDARVMVNYYMSPMPRMAPMNYTTRAKWNGESYTATMRLIMSGPWIIRVLSTHEGKRAAAKFNVDAQ
jgi:YtkA-like